MWSSHIRARYLFGVLLGWKRSFHWAPSAVIPGYALTLTVFTSVHPFSVFSICWLCVACVIKRATNKNTY